MTFFNSLLKSLDFIDNALHKFEGFILALGVMCMALNTIVAVISRFIFNDALTFTGELNVIFIIITTFAGLSYAARKARHIRMSALYDALKKRYRKLLMMVIALITSVFMFMLSYYSYLYIVEVYQSGRILPALQIPVFYIYLWVPVGFFITALQYAFTLIKNLKENNVYLSTCMKDEYGEKSRSKPNE